MIIIRRRASRAKKKGEKVFIKFDGPACANSNQRKQWLYSNADKFYFILKTALKIDFNWFSGFWRKTHRRASVSQSYFFFGESQSNENKKKSLTTFFPWVEFCYNAHFIKAQCHLLLDTITEFNNQHIKAWFFHKNKFRGTRI